MKRFLIGVDTGGTYTDAVIIDAKKNEVIACAKSLTTHGDLSRGVSASLESVLDSNPEIAASDIQQVSLSTTLATNALVEGRGSSIAVVLIGFDEAMKSRTKIASAIPEARIISIDGGHKYDGNEYKPLDEQALKKAVAHLPVDAYAVASHYAVRNPTHERRAASLVRTLTGKPVSTSCDLSDSLDGPLRALTAAFNARIISLIVDLQSAVADSMHQIGISAPIMIVKGDGSIAAAETVIEKPIETILSGPAASVIGARFLTRLNDFVVADMGGTTSDVATVVNGWPKLNPRGANVGGYRTLVKAIDMQTIGLGGDSGVNLDESSNLALTSSRVAPISMLAKLYPVVERELQTALGASSGMRSALDYLILNTNREAEVIAALSDRERQFVATLDPTRPNKSSRAVNGAADRACVRSLIDRGILRQSGFTPSDAAHVLGLQNQWSRAAAVSAAELLGRASYRISGKDTQGQIHALCHEVIDAAVEKSTRLIICELSGLSFTEKDPLVNVIATGNSNINNLGVTFNARTPIVAVGGPASVFYKEVGKRLNVDTHIPPYSHVANAVGAALGIIRAEHCVEITMNESGGYLIHTSAEPEHQDNATKALMRAEEMARRNVQADLKAKGGHSQRIDIEVQRIQIPDIEDDSGLISARITASCDSLPA